MITTPRTIPNAAPNVLSTLTSPSELIAAATIYPIVDITNRTRKNTPRRATIICTMGVRFQPSSNGTASAPNFHVTQAAITQDTTDRNDRTKPRYAPIRNDSNTTTTKPMSIINEVKNSYRTTLLIKLNFSSNGVLNI